jgi:hypothetical protein
MSLVRQVHDGEPAVGKADAGGIIDPQPVVVGTPMCDRLGQQQEIVAVTAGSTPWGQDPRYATHDNPPDRPADGTSQDTGA